MQMSYCGSVDGRLRMHLIKDKYLKRISEVILSLMCKPFAKYCDAGAYRHLESSAVHYSFVKGALCRRKR